MTPAERIVQALDADPEQPMAAMRLTGIAELSYLDLLELAAQLVAAGAIRQVGRRVYQSIHGEDVAGVELDLPAVSDPIEPPVVECRAQPATMREELVRVPEVEPPPARDSSASPGRGSHRAVTVYGSRPLSRSERRAGALLVLPDVRRPSTREECRGMERPCPFVGCKFNLYLDVNPETGSVKLNFPDREPWKMRADASCALDVAARGGVTLEEVGQILNLTRERVRQVEVRVLHKLKLDGEIDGSKDLAVFDRLDRRDRKAVG